jgi:hypothetical protein
LCPAAVLLVVEHHKLSRLVALRKWVEARTAAFAMLDFDLPKVFVQLSKVPEVFVQLSKVFVQLSKVFVQLSVEELVADK